MKILVPALTLGIALLTGCATTATTPQDANAYISAESPRFAEAFNRADWDAVGAYYTSDAVLLAPNAEMASGPAAIRQLFSSYGPMTPQMTLSPARVVQSCDAAYEYGTYQMQMTAQGTVMNDRGKYLTIWRRTGDGRWRIAADMFNTSIPAPGM